MPLDVIAAIAPLRARIARERRTGRSIGFVPTMGALHAGHASLIERARSDCDSVVVSIFVNPLQFDRQDDLAWYPRTLDTDVDLCRSLGVDVVFSPSDREMYPVEPMCAIDVGRLADHLCGRFRPAHFRGVATVVMKLFETVQPDMAYFGEKDAQQLAIVRRLVTDFNVPVTVVGMATVREPDGLALSSRNQRLGAGERQLAVALYRALRTAETEIAAGQTDAGRITQDAKALIPDDPRLRMEYLDIVDPDEIQPVRYIDRPVLVAGALWVGETRLIDNIRCAPPSGRIQP
jgi:pantoate--beta-alanine ligase